MEQEKTSKLHLTKIATISILIVLTISVAYIQSNHSIERTYKQIANRARSKWSLYLNETKFKNKTSKETILSNLATTTRVKLDPQTKWINFFKENQKKQIETVRPPKFVYIGRIGNGYGNQMNSLITGFMIAIATNSALIVDWPYITNLIQEPLYRCFNMNASANNELSYHYRPNEIIKLPHMTANSYNPSKSLSNLYKQLPQGFSRYMLIGVGALFFELACNTNYFPTFLNYGLVSQKSLQAAERVLNTRPIQSSRENVDIVLRVGFEVGHNILKLFWNPTPALQTLVDTFYNANFKDNYVIGMQIRNEYLNWNDVTVFFKCAENVEAATKKPVKWFIASDTNDIVKKIKNLYPKKVLHAEGKIGHVTFDSAAYERALLDIELLSKCDELILTGGSTFGFLAAMRAGQYPLYINGKKNVKNCQRLALSNPSLAPYNAGFFK